jgi:hypothetical protein
LHDILGQSKNSKWIFCYSDPKYCLIEDGIALARSAADAPEIDGLVIIEDGADLTVGEFAEVKVTGSTEHDLIGKRRQD